MAAPLACSLVALVSSVVMGGSDRALMLALPGMAVLAAFALPTLQRSVSAAIDWFSVFFFTGWALTFWVVYLSMHTGVPARPAINVAHLVPDYQPKFSLLALACALLASIAWVALVAWRTGRHRHPDVEEPGAARGRRCAELAAGYDAVAAGVDQAFSYRRLMQRLAAHLPAGSCVAASSLTSSQIAALGLDAPLASGCPCERQRPLRLAAAQCSAAAGRSEPVRLVADRQGAPTWRPNRNAADLPPQPLTKRGGGSQLCAARGYCQ